MDKRGSIGELGSDYHLEPIDGVGICQHQKHRHCLVGSSDIRHKFLCQTCNPRIQIKTTEREA